MYISFMYIPHGTPLLYAGLVLWCVSSSRDGILAWLGWFAQLRGFLHVSRPWGMPLTCCLPSGGVRGPVTLRSYWGRMATLASGHPNDHAPVPACVLLGSAGRHLGVATRRVVHLLHGFVMDPASVWFPGALLGLPVVGRAQSGPRLRFSGHGHRSGGRLPLLPRRPVRLLRSRDARLRPARLRFPLSSSGSTAWWGPSGGC